MCGALYGWLITVIDETLEMHILNPFTWVQLRLPCLDAIRDVNHTTCGYKYIFIKAILTSAPSSRGAGDYSIILLDHHGIAIKEPTSTYWDVYTSSCCEIDDNFVDIIHHVRQLFVLRSYGESLVWYNREPYFFFKGIL